MFLPSRNTTIFRTTSKHNMTPAKQPSTIMNRLYSSSTSWAVISLSTLDSLATKVWWRRGAGWFMLTLAIAHKVFLHWLNALTWPKKRSNSHEKKCENPVTQKRLSGLYVLILTTMTRKVLGYPGINKRSMRLSVILALRQVCHRVFFGRVYLIELYHGKIPEILWK